MQFFFPNDLKDFFFNSPVNMLAASAGRLMHMNNNAACFLHGCLAACIFVAPHKLGFTLTQDKVSAPSKST